MEFNAGFKVQLFFNGRNLKDLDFFSKSDPYIKVFAKKNPNTPSQLMGKTQTIQNNVNPNWTKSIQLDYIFETVQPLIIQVMDQDQKNNDQLIGRVQTTLGALVGARNQTSILAIKDKNGKQCGKIVIRTQKVQESSNNLYMRWRALKLMNTDSWFDFIDKSDPYLKFLKLRKDNTYISVAQTQVIKNNLNPLWKPISIPFGKLIGENTTKFKIQCWDQEKQKDKHQFIGEIFIDVAELKNKTFPLQLNLINKKESNPGKLILEQFKTVVVPTFFDYLRGGLQLNLVIAVDFTGSNGFPSNSQSLHYINPNFPNQYQATIASVWNIIQHYDYDKRIPAFAFGAVPKFPNFHQTQVNHCFPLSGNYSQIQACGLNHFMNLYTNSLKFVQFSGPTYFAPIIRQAFKVATTCRQQGSNVYQVLLILTDGQIHDMQQTVDLIVQGCMLPISIIIVGVGNADFDNMETLDGDTALYSSNNQKATRDIVQFVPFRKYNNNTVALCQQVLKQLPDQVLKYMNLINKMPNMPINVDINNLKITQGPKA